MTVGAPDEARRAQTRGGPGNGAEPIEDAGSGRAAPPGLTSRLLPPLAFAALLVALWQLASRYEPDTVLPSAWRVAATTARLTASGELPSVAWRSLSMMLVGYLASAVVGIGLGLLLARRPSIDRAVSPYFIGLQSLPAAAWVPVSVLVLGAARPAVLAVTVLGALPSIAVGTRDAVHGIPPLLLRAARTLGAHGRTLLARVMLPAAMPGIVSGLSTGWSFAFRALVAAELISNAAGGGLGAFINGASKHGQLDRLLAGVIVIMVIGVAVDRLVFARWQHQMRLRRGLVDAG